MLTDRKADYVHYDLSLNLACLGLLLWGHGFPAPVSVHTHSNTVSTSTVKHTQRQLWGKRNVSTAGLL